MWPLPDEISEKIPEDKVALFLNAEENTVTFFPSHNKVQMFPSAKANDEIREKIRGKLKICQNIYIDGARHHDFHGKTLKLRISENI